MTKKRIDPTSSALPSRSRVRLSSRTGLGGFNAETTACCARNGAAATRQCKKEYQLAFAGREAHLQKASPRRSCWELVCDDDLDKTGAKAFRRVAPGMLAASTMDRGHHLRHSSLATLVVGSVSHRSCRIKSANSSVCHIVSAVSIIAYMIPRIRKPSGRAVGPSVRLSQGRTIFGKPSSRSKR